MKVLVDTSVLVDVDRGDEEVIGLCRKLTLEHDAFVSTVTVSELLTGSYLRRNYAKSVAKAKKILGQFTWLNLDGEVAEKVAQLSAYLLAEGKPIEYQDEAIAASCLAAGCEILLTKNKERFERIPGLAGKVQTPGELGPRLTGS